MWIPRGDHVTGTWFPSDCYMIFRWLPVYFSSPILNQVFSKHASKSAPFQYFSIDALTVKQFPLDNLGLRFASKKSAGVAPEAIKGYAHDNSAFLLQYNKMAAAVFSALK